MVAMSPAGVSSRPMFGPRLKVVHVTATFPPYLGGTGNVVWHNARELARRGHQVTVVTPGPVEPAEASPPAVTVLRPPIAVRLGNAPLAPGLGGALDGADLIHLHYPFYFGGEQVWWTLRRSRRPYVVTYHQDVIFGGLLRHAARLHHALVGQAILRGARLVAATTLDYAEHSRLRQLPIDRVVELPNGVDVDRFRPDLDTGPLRGRLGLSAKAAVILFVGGLDRAHYFKGVPVLLHALAHLPAVQLVVVGDGDLRGQYQAQAQALGLGSRVQFAGRVTEDDLPRYYSLADLTVLPSTTQGEAFGLVLLESLACGTPVVASRLPGVRAVVDEGRDGLLVEAGDARELARAIGSLLADPGRRRAMGGAGRARVERCYAWPKIGERLESLYGEALNERGPAGNRSTVRC